MREQEQFNAVCDRVASGHKGIVVLTIALYRSTIGLHQVAIGLSKVAMLLRAAQWYGEL
jgi:hypothetical protein